MSSPRAPALNPGDVRLGSRYGHEPLTLRNIDSCLIRRGLAESVAKACHRWQTIAPGGTLLDIGCGAQPYRPWVSACGLKYQGVDWGSSIHSAPTGDTILCDLSRPPWPFPEGTFDALLCTEVLEHQPDPAPFLAECHRVSRSGAEMLLTAPLTWPEHEQPHDYYRYTRYGLHKLLEDAGFEVVEIWPRGGWHLAMAQLLGLWSYFAVPKPLNYFTRIAVWPLMQLLALLDSRSTSIAGPLPLTLGFSVLAKRR